NGISVRERSGVKLIEETWGLKNIVKVVDPTLLLGRSDYSSLIDRSEVKYEKIQPLFCYILGENDGIIKFIKKISDYRRQAVTKSRAHGGAGNDILPPVELWLKGFRDSELVITNSFHGMMFSILNNTDFIIIGREEGGWSR